MDANPLARLQNIPPLTLFYLVACVCTTIGIIWGMISPLQIAFIPSLIWERFQIWRLVTPFFYFGKDAWSLIMTLFSVYMYMNDLEGNMFQGRTKNFVYLILTFWGAILVISSLLSPWHRVYFPSHIFLYSLSYLVSRHPKNANSQTLFFGIIPIPTVIFPYVMILVQVLFQSIHIIEALIIFIVGHTFYFLMFVVPSAQFGGPDLLAFINPDPRPLPFNQRPAQRTWGDRLRNTFGNGPSEGTSTGRSNKDIEWGEGRRLED